VLQWQPKGNNTKTQNLSWNKYKWEADTNSKKILQKYSNMTNQQSKGKISIEYETEHNIYFRWKKTQQMDILHKKYIYII